MELAIPTCAWLAAYQLDFQRAAAAFGVWSCCNLGYFMWFSGLENLRADPLKFPDKFKIVVIR